MEIQLFLTNHKWEIFIGTMILLLAIDFIGHHLTKDHKEHEMSLNTALKWTIFWVAAGLLFGLFIYYIEGASSASAYYSSYLLEKGLSVDNIAVWLAILTGLQMSKDNWHKLLTWGIVGAIFFRGIFIFGGMNIIEHFSFLTIILGFFLLVGSFKISGLGFDPKKFRFYEKHNLDQFVPDKSTDVKIINKILNKFFPHLSASQTTFIITLFTIEITDIVFALDSVPVIIALNTSTYVAATSNLFAILGLRALFFVISDFLSRLEYLKYGLAVILLFIAFKMIFEIHLDPLLSLAIIITILLSATLTSLLHKSEKERNINL